MTVAGFCFLASSHSRSISANESVSDRTARRGRLGFDELKSFDESVGGLAQSVFRIHLDETGKVDE